MSPPVFPPPTFPFGLPIVLANIRHLLEGDNGRRFRAGEGHGQAFDFKSKLFGTDEVFVAYEMQGPDGPMPSAEHLRFEDGKIAAIRVYFGQKRSATRRCVPSRYGSPPPGDRIRPRRRWVPFAFVALC